MRAAQKRLSRLCQRNMSSQMALVQDVALARSQPNCLQCVLLDRLQQAEARLTVDAATWPSRLARTACQALQQVEA